jgi:hypothetical protein
MKLNELIGEFTIALSNEEANVLQKIKGMQHFEQFTEREKIIIENLIRKSLVSKIMHKGIPLVMKNEFGTD